MTAWVQDTGDNTEFQIILQSQSNMDSQSNTETVESECLWLYWLTSYGKRDVFRRRTECVGCAARIDSGITNSHRLEEQNALRQYLHSAPKQCSLSYTQWSSGDARRDSRTFPPNFRLDLFLSPAANELTLWSVMQGKLKGNKQSGPKSKPSLLLLLQ